MRDIGALGSEQSGYQQVDPVVESAKGAQHAPATLLRAAVSRIRHIGKVNQGAPALAIANAALSLGGFFGGIPLPAFLNCGLIVMFLEQEVDAPQTSLLWSLFAVVYPSQSASKG